MYSIKFINEGMWIKNISEDNNINYINISKINLDNMNAEKIKITGNKLNDHLHYWHTGYPGGIKSRSYSDILEGKNPHKVIQLAVKRMVPKGPLGKQQLTKLHVYSGDKHPHEAQNPELIDLGIMNRKNKRDL